MAPERGAGLSTCSPRPFLGTAYVAGSASGCMCWGPELWEPVSWGLGTGWWACSSGGIFSGTLDAALGPEGKVGKRFQWLVPQ